MEETDLSIYFEVTNTEPSDSCTKDKHPAGWGKDCYSCEHQPRCQQFFQPLRDYINRVKYG